MENQTVGKDAETVAITDIVEKRNGYQIGPWSVTYNGAKNPVKFAFDETDDGSLRVAVIGSNGWVRLLRPVEAVEKSGVYSVSLATSSTAVDPLPTCESLAFTRDENGAFRKHSKLKLRDGHYRTKLHLSTDGPELWVGFETKDSDVEIVVRRTRLIVSENAVDLARGLAGCRTVDLPLATSAPKSHHYTSIERSNREYADRIADGELPFLLEYAEKLRRVEMPESFLRLVRYLVTQYASHEQELRTSLVSLVREALMISHDVELVELIVRNCPEMLPALDLGDAVLAKIIGLDQIDAGVVPHRLDEKSYFSFQDEPQTLFGLVHREVKGNQGFLRSNPIAYCALANAYASRPGGETLYRSYLNKYLESQDLPQLEVTRIVKSQGLGGMSFAATSHTIENGPLVSIVMSAYDAGATIGYAIDSLLKQSYRNIEVLVCDDHSADATVEIARQRASRDSRVRVFQSAHNQGTYNIRNDLIQEARGEFITFHDSDDLALPCRIEKQLGALADERKAVCFSSWLRIRPDGRVVFFHDGRASRFCSVSAMAHRSVFERLPPFRSSLVAADTEFYELCKCLLGEDDIAMLPQPLVLGLWGESSLTRQQDLVADHTGYVAEKRRQYAEIAARQRLLGEGIVSDKAVEAKLRQLEIYRKPAGLASEIVQIGTVASGPTSVKAVADYVATSELTAA